MHIADELRMHLYNNLQSCKGIYDLQQLRLKESNAKGAYTLALSFTNSARDYQGSAACTKVWREYQKDFIPLLEEAHS